MMICKVLKSFSDLQDGQYVYKAGDWFPRLNTTVTDERIAELASCNNSFGCPLIEVIAEEEDKGTPEGAETVEKEPEIIPVRENPQPAKRAGKRGKRSE